MNFQSVASGAWSRRVAGVERSELPATPALGTEYRATLDGWYPVRGDDEIIADAMSHSDSTNRSVKG
jgi:hypothetical protein